MSKENSSSYSHGIHAIGTDVKTGKPKAIPLPNNCSDFAKQVEGGSSGSGPALVSTDEFREGWDNIFGSRKNEQN